MSQFRSRIFEARCFVARVSTLDRLQRQFIASFVILVGKWLARLVGQVLEGCPPLASLEIFVYDLGQVSSSFCVSHNIV